ncbi:TetR/AcrR family transcriptional regulator [Actinokineospora sp. NBRC 105648]|uniref:TetR/AcrR family transcriptional regulator n=1 Tax=Actinokineospora sp. NBRC 105648 TaxID=3032206 RepID=UPI0024A15A15|nr:TetR/AcrR family transcriptional regulator [Actinokineospora sp. NBRC 105648]GLZ36493.1 TetR family transcriptional regulator [Actinokineospora sp. NBRC 105648]
MATRRERLREQTSAEIKATALAHLREGGGAALSLRAVAVSIGMSPAGLYRYYPNREALITDLITDGFAALAEEVTRARDAAKGDAFVAAALAYRQWALTHPHEFALLYGTPIPDYAAPESGPTSHASRAVGAAFVPPIIEAWHRGTLKRREVDPTITALNTFAAAVDLPPDAAAIAFTAWTTIHGLVVLETFGHLAWLGENPAPLAESRFQALSEDLGIAP